MMLGIGAIQRVKESARGDGKGYFSIAMQRRTAGCSKDASGNIKHRRADAQMTTVTPALGPAPGHRLGPMRAHLDCHHSGLGQLSG